MSASSSVGSVAELPLGVALGLALEVGFFVALRRGGSIASRTFVWMTP